MPKKLLVIDSNLAVQKLVEHSIPRSRFEVTCLNDGLTALDLLTRINPDIILADYQLEGINIARFCEKVKQKFAGRERPVLLMVGQAENIDTGRLLSLGVVDFVKKPLDPQQLLQKLTDQSEESATVVDRMTQNAPAPSAPGGTAGQSMEDALGWSESNRPAATPDFEQTLVAGHSPTPPPSTTDTAVKITREALEAAFPQMYSGSVQPSRQADPAPSGPDGPLTPQALDPAIQQMAREIIEKITWDVVPQLAEILIKEELEKLKTDKSS